MLEALIRRLCVQNPALPNCKGCVLDLKPSALLSVKFAASALQYMFLMSHQNKYRNEGLMSLPTKCFWVNSWPLIQWYNMRAPLSMHNHDTTKKKKRMQYWQQSCLGKKFCSIGQVSFCFTCCRIMVQKCHWDSIVFKPSRLRQGLAAMWMCPSGCVSQHPPFIK